jgi:hypothetical protein
MKVTVELEKEDFDVLHDVILGATGYGYNEVELQSVWDKLPEHITATAIEWGTNDTVFRDNLYEYIEKEIKYAKQ